MTYNALVALSTSSTVDEFKLKLLLAGITTDVTQIALDYRDMLWNAPIIGKLVCARCVDPNTGHFSLEHIMRIKYPIFLKIARKRDINTFADQIDVTYARDGKIMVEHLSVELFEDMTTKYGIDISSEMLQMLEVAIGWFPVKENS